MRSLNRSLLILICLTLLPNWQLHAETITVAWRHKPPHQYIENGKEKGALLELAKQVFADTKLNARFVEEPAKRIWHNFSSGTTNYCSFGWYKIPGREAIVQFSQSFHKDPPHTLIVSAKALSKVRTHKTLTNLLQDPQLSLAIVDGVSYGETIDNLFRQSKNRIIRSSAAPAIMARMINADRASFMFIDREDWHHLQATESNLNELTQLDMQDMPPGLDRYIVCSKDVATAVMNKIDASLAKIAVTNNLK
nr:transporter substrate-binding domain-containing protein [uncultured Undibacterium sp.]